MRTFLLMIVLALACESDVFGQAIRFDTVSYTTSASCVSGKICPVQAIPGTTVSVCTGTQTTLAACQSAAATTYTSTSAVTSCSPTAQLTPATGGACRSTSDNQGNAGFWILPGNYTYFLVVPSSAGGGTYGPYPISVGASSGCPLGAVCDANYSTLAAACTAAGSGTLYITRNWSATPTQTLCRAQFLGNGKITMASSAALTVGSPLTAPANQRIFDVSASSSSVVFTQGTVAQGYPTWFGAVGNGVTDSLPAIRATLSAFPRQNIVFPSGTYFMDNTGLATVLTTNAASIKGFGVTIKGARWSTTGATGGIDIDGIYFDNTDYPYGGAAVGPILQISADNVNISNSWFAFRKNYTAIQIAGQTVSSCVDNVNLSSIHTTTNGQSHITPTCVSNLHINKWKQDAATTNDGLNLDDGLALFGLSGSSHDITLDDVTGEDVYDILKITNSVYGVERVSATNLTCRRCVTPVWIEGTTFGSGAGVPIRGVTISASNFSDEFGTNMRNCFYLYGDTTNLQDISFRGNNCFGRLNNAASDNVWVRILGSNGSVMDNIDISGNHFTTVGGSGSAPAAFILGQNNVNFTRWTIKNNIVSGGVTGPGVNLTSVQFSNPWDLVITGNVFSDFNTASPASAANAIHNRVIWDNKTVLANNQPELVSANSSYPIGITVSEATGAAYAGVAAGTRMYVNDAAPTDPISSRSAALGGADCIMKPSGVWNCNQAPAVTNTSRTAWTPSLQFGGAAVGMTYATQSADYARVGDLVIVTVRITLSAKGSSTGTATIAGLPFAGYSGDAFYSSPVQGLNIAGISSPAVLTAIVQGSSITINTINQGGTGAGALDDTYFANNSSLQFSISYHI